MDLSTSTRGSMRTRSTSDKRSDDERRTNVPWDVHQELKTEGRDKSRAGFPTQPPKFGRIFFTVSLVGPRLRGEELKSHNPVDLQTREGGDKKKLEGYTTRNNVRHNVSTVRLWHIPTEGPERQEVINKARVPTEGPERQEVINKRPECLPKDQSVKKLSAKATVPTEEPERQEVINKGQHARLERPTKRPTGWKPHADRTFLYDGSTYEHQWS